MTSTMALISFLSVTIQKCGRWIDIAAVRDTHTPGLELVRPGQRVFGERLRRFDHRSMATICSSKAFMRGNGRRWGHRTTRCRAWDASP